MSWTKRQFVNAAFEEIGLGNYAFDMQAEQLQAALHRLDALIGTWNAKGIRLGYPLTSSPEDADLDTETNVPDSANEAIYKNLAVRLAPTVGKQVSRETMMAAHEAYRGLLSLHTQPIERQLDNSAIPAGAGNKPYRWSGQELLKDPVDRLEAGNDGIVDLD